MFKKKMNLTSIDPSGFGIRLVPTGVGTDPATDPRRSVSAETESAGR